MILVQTRESIRSLGTGTVSQIAADSGNDIESVETALSFWIRRGDVVGRETRVQCDNCCRCGTVTPSSRDDQVQTVYEWVGAPGGES